jgi:hypothetical protein
MKHVCVRCSADFEAEERKSGRKRLYCDVCRPLAQRDQIREWHLRRRELRGIKTRTKMPPEERARRRRERNIRDRPKRREIDRQRQIAKRAGKVCQRCGDPLPTKYVQRYCCRQCSKGKPKLIPLTERLCAECEAPFMPKTRKGRFCGNRCQDAYWRRIRRAREKKVTVERFGKQEIFERDGWICQLCGRPVKKCKRRGGGYDPDAPQLDHIVPLNAKGSHTRANVQLTHARCNIKKHVKLLGQLRLFG